MPTIVHGFDWPDRIVVGTIGQPGARAFYLQVRSGPRVVSVALEKEQSAALALKVDEVLDDLMVDGNPFNVPAEIPVELVDNEPLDQPVEPDFRAASMSLGWDPSTMQVVIEAFASPEENDFDVDYGEPYDDEPAAYEPEEMLVVRIPVGSARAFAKRTLEVVGAGRPMCPLCGMPMHPEGHVCAVLDGLE